MTFLYCVLPPLMAWRIVSKHSDPSSAVTSKDDKAKMEITSGKSVLVAMGVLSVLMVFEQIFQDLVTLKTALVS
jgi:tyrosine-specific transport protein